jgi:hypothetical protein
MLDTLKCSRCDHLAQFCECGEYHDARKARPQIGTQPRCEHCGRTDYTGAQVGPVLDWSTGKPVVHHFCRNQVSCWHRQGVSR